MSNIMTIQGSATDGLQTLPVNLESDTAFALPPARTVSLSALSGNALTVTFVAIAENGSVLKTVVVMTTAVAGKTIDVAATFNDGPDNDGDGVGADVDCDDNHPAVHPATASDPYPDPPNCCGYSLGKTGAESRMNYLGTPLCPTQRCGDKVDEACKGTDTICIVDDDCDGFSPLPYGADCDDTNSNAYPGAPEPCGSTSDLNCSGKVNDGC